MPIDKFVEVKGMKIDPDRIENLKLLKVFRSRIQSGNSFLFRYGDHTDRSTRENYDDTYSDHREYNDHHDHTDRHRDYATGNHGGNHTDRHTDRG